MTAGKKRIKKRYIGYLAVGHPKVIVGLVVAISEETAQLTQVETIHFHVAYLLIFDKVKKPINILHNYIS